MKKSSIAKILLICAAPSVIFIIILAAVFVVPIFIPRKPACYNISNEEAKRIILDDLDGSIKSGMAAGILLEKSISELDVTFVKRESGSVKTDDFNVWFKVSNKASGKDIFYAVLFKDCDIEHWGAGSGAPNAPARAPDRL